MSQASPHSETSPLILALDFGGTKLAAAVTQGYPQWRSQRRTLSPVNADAGTDFALMRSLAQEVLQGQKPAAIGVSFGGPVSASTGTVRLSHHVKGWENVPLQQRLEAEFNAPARVDNDANVAALGEHRFGAGVGCDHLFYITVSTGVGGGWILNGNLWQGSAGMAGEIGHTVVDPKGPPCLCGKRGCVERLASGPYIVLWVKEQLQKNRSHGQILRALVQGNEAAITAQIVSQAAQAGDELAITALEQAGWALGVGIGNAANLINPQRFILGGGVTKAGERFWHQVRQTARETALPEVNFEILPAALGDDAPLWGAVVLASSLLGD